MLKRSLALACCLAFVACSDDETTTTPSSSSAITTGYNTVTSKSSTISNLKPGSSFVESDFETLGNNYGSEWTTATSPFVDNSTDPGQDISPKAWMGIQLAEDAENANGSKVNMLGRLSNALGIFCGLGIGVDSSNLDADGYPVNGSLSIEFTSALVTKMESTCKIDASQFTGNSISLEVSDATGSTYDKKIVMTLPTSTVQTYYVKSDSTGVNIATAESNDNGLSRTVIAYDASSKVMKLEYISAPDAALANSDHVAAYRMYYDETNDEGYMMTLEHTEDTTDSYVQYILAGKPNTTGAKFSLSMISTGLNNATAYDACVNSSDGSIDTDGSRCSASSTTLAGYDVTGSEVTSFATGWDNTQYNSVSASTALSFTTTDFATEAFSTN